LRINGIAIDASAKSGLPGMNPLSNLVTGAALFAVALVLLLGLANMVRGGSPNLSQKLMRWRVGLQLVAIIVIMIVLFLRR
jgi:hypothetical protein